LTNTTTSYFGEGFLLVHERNETIRSNFQTVKEKKKKDTEYLKTRDVFFFLFSVVLLIEKLKIQ
jgi:hypothetical protein